MRRAKPIQPGNQASDELGPVALTLLWVIAAALLVAPAIFVFHLVAGDEDAAAMWGMNSIVPALLTLLVFAGMRSSARDARQLRARGVPGTATVLSVEPLDDGHSALLRIHVDGLEPFLARARTDSRLKTGGSVAVLVDPSDKLFTIVDH